MAANGSGPPALMNIGIPIAETIAAIDNIMKRREDRKAAQSENFFANLYDDLEVIFTAVKALDDKFSALVNAYSNKDIIEDPILLKELGKQTKNYLTVSEIVPRLRQSIGTIEIVAKNPNITVPGPGHIAVPAQLQIILKELSEQALHFHDTLKQNPNVGVNSGVGGYWLLQLCMYTEQVNWKPDANQRQDILVLAYNALNVYSFELSSRIYRLVGQAKLYC